MPLLSSLLHAFGILLFASAWLAFDHYRPWVNFHSEALALLGIGLLAAGRVVGRTRLVAPPWIWFVLVVAAVPWVQWATGISLFAGDAVMASLYLCAFAVALVLGVSCAREGSDSVEFIFITIWFVAIVSGAIGLLQWLTLQEPLGMYVVQTAAGERALGNMGQPNQLATLLLMGGAALVWTYERRRVGAIGTICGVVFMTLILVLTQSRTGILSAIVVTLFLVWKSPVVFLRVRRWHIAAWLVGYVVALQMLPWVHELLLMGDGRSLNLARDDARIMIWKQMLAGIWESPWVGYGWNQTPTAHAAGAIRFPWSITYTNAHNVVLDLLAWNGIPLGITIVLACVWWLLSRMWVVKDVAALCAMASLLPIGVHSLLEYPFAYSYFLLAAGLMVGVVEAACRRSSELNIPRRFFLVFVSAWFLVGAYAISEYVQVEEDFRIVRFENLRIGRTPEEYKAPQDIRLLSQLGAMLKAARQEAKRGMSQEEVENLRTTSLRFSYGSLAFRYALALGLNGQPEAATRQMQVVRGMYGDYYYYSAVSILRSMEKERYPELEKVATP